jgi:hypothetical protein
MANRLTSTLTAFAMMLHSILGCCTHHVHAEESQAASGLCHHIDHKVDHSDDSDNRDQEQTDLESKREKCGHHHHGMKVAESSPAAEATPYSCGYEQDRSPQHRCNECKCRFVKTAVTESPRPDQPGSATNTLRSIADLGLAPLLSEGTGLEVALIPPGCWCAALCAAPVTQVWQL